MKFNKPKKSKNYDLSTMTKIGVYAAAGVRSGGNSYYANGFKNQKKFMHLRRNSQAAGRTIHAY